MDQDQLVKIIEKQFLKLSNELYNLVLDVYGEAEHPPIHELEALESILKANRGELMERLGGQQ